jgi:hypothetical protein
MPAGPSETLPHRSGRGPAGRDRLFPPAGSLTGAADGRSCRTTRHPARRAGSAGRQAAPLRSPPDERMAAARVRAARPWWLASRHKHQTLVQRSRTPGQRGKTRYMKAIRLCVASYLRVEFVGGLLAQAVALPRGMTKFASNPASEDRLILLRISQAGWPKQTPSFALARCLRSI